MLFLQNEQKKLFLFLFFLSSSFGLIAQTVLPKLETSLNAPSDRNILEDRTQWKEIESERKINSSTFLTPDGRTIIHYSKEPLNYYSNGNLVPINTIPVISHDGLIAVEQPFPVKVTKSGAVLIGNTTYSSECKINGLELKISDLSQTGANAIMKDVIPGIDKTFGFHFNAVEYNYILNHPIANGNQDFVIEEKVIIPENAKLLLDYNFGTQSKDGWLGSLTIKSSTGEEIGRMRGAVCFDANKNYCAASYKIEDKNGMQTIKIIVPNTWINNPNRVYPITIDPLVTGPTSTWGGSYIASCLAPANNADSILVTIPAQITVTGFFVSGSYYASPFTTALMSDGQMFFSTSCSNSTTFTVAPPTGSTPGTAYLTAFDLRSPLTCCFPQSCSSQSFYLLMHLYRTAPGIGCNTTYLYHDPFSGYPFSAYIEGHTIESYGLQWAITPATICSNVCNVLGTVYIKYGVPPFTITHPWVSGSVTAGVAVGCSFATISKQLNLTIPLCPWICDTVTMLSIPPPTVTDACGNIIGGLLPKIITIKETPTASANPNPATVCSDVPFIVNLNSCIPGSTFTWNGNSISGTSGSIVDVISNTTTTVTSTNYTITTASNLCNSAPITLVVNTDPLPVAGISVPVPIIINMPVTFGDNSTSIGGTANSWYWTFGDNTSSISQNPIHTFAVPGVYTVCLAMATTDGCVDTICTDVTVIPAELVIPNVITPNGDNQNDYLYFQYLEYFGNNSLEIFDRWGKVVYSKKNYANDWNAKGCHDGTYYFILKTSDGKNYPGFVQVIQK